MQRPQSAARRVLLLACSVGHLASAIVAFVGAQIGTYGAATLVMWVGFGVWYLLLHLALVIAASRIYSEWQWRTMSTTFVALGIFLLALTPALGVEGDAWHRATSLSWGTLAVLLGWLAMRTVQPEFNRALLRDQLLECVELARDGTSVLGERGWMLFSQYGRVMNGPHQGLYVSGIPTVDARVLLAQLASGNRIPVHLMHRHRSGHYESSSLRLRGGDLVMQFPEREELA